MKKFFFSSFLLFSVSLVGVISATEARSAFTTGGSGGVFTATNCSGGSCPVQEGDSAFTTQKQHKNTSRDFMKKSQTFRASGVDCGSVEMSLKKAKSKGVKLPLRIKSADNTINGIAHKYVLIPGIESIKNNFIPESSQETVQIKQIKTRKGEMIAVVASMPRHKRVNDVGWYDEKKLLKSRAICPINVCPVVMIGDKEQKIKVYCTNPKSILEKITTRTNPNGGSLFHMATTSKTMLKPQQKISRPNQKPRSATKQQQKRRPSSAQQKKKQSDKGLLNGLMKKMQGMLGSQQKKKAQDEARKRREKALKEKEFQAKLRLPKCDPRYPYYNQVKDRCLNGTTTRPIIHTYGDATSTHGGANNIAQTQNSQAQHSRVRRATSTEVMNACKSGHSRGLIVARPRAVKSGAEVMIKWASVCTATCAVTAHEIGITDEPVLTELGRKGRITGKLYNDTEFVLTCKDFNDEIVATSTAVVKLKQ